MPRILLVEDDVPTQEMLARRLERRGYEVVVASDGSTALALAHGERPDLVLMDLRLPVMDGLTATSHLKSDPRSRDVPIIALTAHAMPDEQAMALQTGCDEVETKPVDFPRLLSKIEALLKRAIH